VEILDVGKERRISKNIKSVGLQLNTNVKKVYCPARFGRNEGWLVSWIDKYKEYKSVFCRTESEAQRLVNNIDPEVIVKKGFKELEKELEMLTTDNKVVS
jgi:hypothetical protein